MLNLPGLIDPHVHVREPGATHKEDWDTATQSALAGGITVILAMPNTTPPIFDAATLQTALTAARAKARCDYAQYLGAGPHNAPMVAALAEKAAGLKMYLDSTFGELRLNDMTLWQPHFEQWHPTAPLVVHAESRTLAAAILFAALYNRPIHIAHVSLREEILLIRAAKARGIPVTCEVCPHHLFLTAQDLNHLAPGCREVRPRLATPADVQALWDNLDVIDCFATDHAPHTLQEKESDTPPPGFPGLETILPLLLTAVRENRLSLHDIVTRMVINPRKIFHLPEQPDTFIEIDETARYELRAAEMHSRAGWTPFEGLQVYGKVHRVILRGRTVYAGGKILAEMGFGRNLKDNAKTEAVGLQV